MYSAYVSQIRRSKVQVISNAIVIVVDFLRFFLDFILYFLGVKNMVAMGFFQGWSVHSLCLGPIRDMRYGILGTIVGGGLASPLQGLFAFVVATSDMPKVISL